MKIGIITFHRANNCGAVLQAYALSHAIASRGSDCEVIDYHSPHRAKINRLFAAGKGKNRLRRYAGALLNMPIRALRLRRFRQFCRKNLPLSEMCTKDDLPAISKRYDRIVTGSDQVWSMKHTKGDDAYFLDFAEPEKRFAYAASFGKGEQFNEADRERVAALLRDFRALSVREESGIETARKLTGREALRMPDPVLLVDAEHWRTLVHRKPPQKPYVFIYVISYMNKQMQEAATEIAQKEGLEIQIVQRSLQKNIAGRYTRAFSPEDLLRMVSGARYVVTNSFHGTAFSILFKKNFWTFETPKCTEDNRITTLLHIFGFNDRLIGLDAQTPDLFKPVDFSKAGEALKSERERAFSYIDSCILGGEREDGLAC